MSETEKSANLSAKVEASDEPNVSTTPSSGDNGESAEAQDANAADDNALQSSSAGLRDTSSVEAAPSVSPAADSSSIERQNAPTQPAGKNLMIDFAAFLNEYDYPRFFCSLVNYGMLHQYLSNDIQEYLDETKLYSDEELRNESLRIQEWLKVLLSTLMVKVKDSFVGEQAIYDFIKRNFPFLNEDVAKTQAKKAHNYKLKYLMKKYKVK